MSGAHLQAQALTPLEAADDLGKVSSLWVAPWAEHAHEAFRRLVSETAKLLKPDCGVEIVAQHGCAGVHVGGEQAFDPFVEQISLKAGSRSTRAWIVSLKSRIRAIALGLLSLVLFVLLPEVLGGLDTLLLAFFGAAAEQDDEGVSVLAEIDPVAGAEI